MRTLSINIQRLIYLLMTTESFLPIEEIAKNLNLSKRTINNYLFFLRTDEEYCEIIKVIKTKNGFKINSNENHEIEYKQLKNRLQILFSSEEEKYRKSSIDRIMDILLLLLDNNSYIRLNDISTNLYYSKSVLDKDLVLCKKILGQYNLKLISKTHYGMIIEGEELYKRFLLTEIVETKHKEEGILNEFTRYSKYYANDGTYRTEIKKIVMDVLNKTTCSIISNQTLKRSYKYLIISLARLNDGLVIDINQDIFKYVKNTEQYKVAVDIINEINLENDSIRKSEIYGFAVYLLSRTQFNEKNPSNMYKEFYHYAKSMTKDLLDNIIRDYKIDIRQINTESENLILDYFTLFNIRLLLKATKIHALSYYNNQANKDNPSLSYILAKNSLDKISDIYSIRFDEHYILRLANLFKYFFDHYQYYHRQAKVVLTTDYGYLENNEIKKKLLKLDYEGYISNIDIVNFYQLGMNDAYKEYDLLLLDYPEAYYLPIIKIPVENISLVKDEKIIFHILKNITVNITQILDEIIPNGLKISEIDDISSCFIGNSANHSFINEIVSKYGVVYENVIILLIPDFLTQQTLFNIYRISNNMNCALKYLVLFSSKNIISKSFVKLLDHMFINIDTIIEEIEATSSKTLSNESLAKCIKDNNLY